MPRPALHSPESIMAATRDLVFAAGARSVTVDAIAAASGAPVGSIYHRFGSLDGLLAEMWIAAVQRFQDSFVAALDRQAEPRAAAVSGAVAVYDFAREDPADARLLAALRHEDLFDAAPEDLNRPAELALASLSRRLFGNSGPAALQRTTFAVVDIPLGAVRRHLLAGSALPRGLRSWIETAVRAALKD